MIDMHVHILPGVDDGAKDEQSSREMMRRAADAGITLMIATPHVYRTADQLRNRRAFGETRHMAREYGVVLEMGCEFNYRTMRESGTEVLDDFCLGGTKCLLLEFSNEFLMPRWDAVISEIMDNGYLPIIAHPERYRYIQRDFGIAQAMSDLGCEMQVDACGLMAGLLSAEQRTARKLLKEGYVSYIASDAHSPEDYKEFEKVRRVFRGEWPEGSRLLAQLRAQKKARVYDDP